LPRRFEAATEAFSTKKACRLNLGIRLSPKVIHNMLGWAWRSGGLE
jgi:hypothetical protein